MLVTLEVICHGYLLKLMAPGIISILYFLLGTAVALYPLHFAGPDKKDGTHDLTLWKLGGFTCLLLLALNYSYDLWDSVPVDYTIADMIPIMMIMSERLLAGQEVYAIIPEIWGGMQPIYLPAMWMPFVPAAFFEFEPRFIPMLLMFFSFLVVLVAYVKKGAVKQELYVFFPASLLIISLLLIHPNFTSMSEEGIVVAYYLLLAVGIHYRRPWLFGLAISLCLMSRYALIGWLVMYSLYMLIFSGKREIISTGFYTLFFTLLWLIMGKSLFNFDVFIEVPSNYMEAIRTMPDKYEPLIQNSLGLAKFVKYDNLGAFNHFFQAGVWLVPLSLLAYCWMRRNRLNMALFGLCSLKLSLVFFYNFLIMPYLYLFYTSTFLSLAIYIYYTRRDTDQSLSSV